jgi:hypothetical protein
MSENKDRNNWEKSEYSKTIGIKPDNLEYIRKIKGKKSLAGMLDLIIENFKIKH